MYLLVIVGGFGRVRVGLWEFIVVSGGCPAVVLCKRAIFVERCGVYSHVYSHIKAGYKRVRVGYGRENFPAMDWSYTYLQ